MGTLVEAWRQHQIDQHEKDMWNEVKSFVRAGMYPFHSGRITMSWMEPGFEDLDRTLLIELEAVPNYPFKFKFDEAALFRAWEPEAFFLESIARPVVKHFRYRPTLPVDDHIVLGEE